MIVYADILIILNFLVDYFIIMLTAHLIKTSVTLTRQIISAALGAMSSLLIFLPEFNEFAQFFSGVIIALIMTATAFGVKRIKKYFRTTAILFVVTCGYAGGMFAFWSVFRPEGMVIHNSVVYFNISPIFLICFSVIAFLITVILSKLLDKNATIAENCEICLFANGKSITVNAIADTGNSMEDVFGLSEIIIADRAAFNALFDAEYNENEIRRRYRALPCNTVSGSDILDGYRCDKAYIKHNDTTFEISKPILAVSKTSLGGDYTAIINPKLLT